MKPLCIDLYCGLEGWGEAFALEGYHVVGYDIVDMCEMIGHPRPKGCELVLRDVRSLTGAELIREYGIPAIIVGSSPCQEFSYRAMPWKRAKALPPPYLGIELFQAQFRIQREACEAAGRYIPMVVENVRGAQKWVGRARWHFGSYYLWGDVPALMPMTFGPRKVPGFRFDGSGKSFQTASVEHQKDFVKLSGNDWNDFKRNGKVSPHWRMQALLNPQNGELHASIKGTGGSWFTPDEGSREEVGHWKQGGCITRCYNSKDIRRKAASALIAKIPFPLAQHIARCFKPEPSPPETTIPEPGQPE